MNNDRADLAGDPRLDTGRSRGEDAFRAYATLGEMSSALKKVFGVYQEVSVA